jgi:hypothetical protein
MLTFRKRSLLYLVFSLIFCFAIEAKAQRFAPTLADKREIIKILLEEAGKSTNKTIYLSNKNIPTALRNNFPRIKDVQIKLVSEESESSSMCPYEFGRFIGYDNKYIDVSFGNCNEGLGYTFKKIRGKWKAVPNSIEK